MIISEKDNSAISLPCLRGQVEDWIYYVTLMQYGEISSRFKLAEEIHKNKTLNELLQRALTSRSSEIGEYVLKQKQHFFNAIIAGIYEGEPRWIDIDLKGVSESQIHGDPQFVKDAIGVLELNGSEKIFAIDGQHRVEGIKYALENSSSKKSTHHAEEGVVIFVAHSGTKAGLERTRRLFSTLNRHAKPVKLGEIISLDEDDSIAVLTRRLLYHDSYLDMTGAIAASKTKNLTSSDKVSLTSIQALYEFLERVLLGGKGWKRKQINEFKLLRKSNEELDLLYSEISEIISDLVSNFDELKSYFKKGSQLDATPFRGGASGGSLVFRPIGLSVLGECLAYCKLSSQPLKRAINSLSKVNRNLDQAPWAGLLYDPVNQRMRRVTRADLRCASLAWLHMADLLNKDNQKQLVDAYIDAHEIDQKAAKILISKLPKI